MKEIVSRRNNFFMVNHPYLLASEMRQKMPINSPRQLHVSHVTAARALAAQAQQHCHPK
jgi:hypothetical protein